MVEIGTALAAGLPTVTVVLNNGCWGAEKAYQRDFFGGRYIGADIVNPAFDEVARAFGAKGVRAETARRLRAPSRRGCAGEGADRRSRSTVDPDDDHELPPRFFPTSTRRNGG